MTNKLILILFLICFSLNLVCQENPNNFNIGNYIEVFDDDSILVYYNFSGVIVNKDCADYFRKGKMDCFNINVDGLFYDYYITGELAFIGNMYNNQLNGNSTFFYNNGKIFAKGNYRNNKKNGIWKYYYENGQLKKILNYVLDEPFIVEYYKKNGRKKVENGNGNYKGSFFTHKNLFEYNVRGKVKNGKKHGKWFLSNPNMNGIIAEETFQDGIFIKGNSRNTAKYISKNRMQVMDPENYYYNDFNRIRIEGFSQFEVVSIYDHSFSCNNSIAKEIQYKYNSLFHDFYPSLIDSIININQSINNQWVIVGIKIVNSKKLDQVIVKSSINDILLEEKINKIIKSMKNWNVITRTQEKVDVEKFFTILFFNNTIVIPTYYLYLQ